MTSIVQDETVWFHLLLLPVLGNYLFHWQEEQESELLVLTVDSLDFPRLTKNYGRPCSQIRSPCCSGQQTVEISALLPDYRNKQQLVFLPSRICMWCDPRCVGSASELSSLTFYCVHLWLHLHEGIIQVQPAVHLGNGRLLMVRSSTEQWKAVKEPSFSVCSSLWS